MSITQYRQESSPHICQNWKRKEVKDPKRELQCPAILQKAKLAWMSCSSSTFLIYHCWVGRYLCWRCITWASIPSDASSPASPHLACRRQVSWCTNLAVWRGASVAAAEVGQPFDEVPRTLLISWWWSLSMCTRPAWWLPSFRVCCNITLLLPTAEEGSALPIHSCCWQDPLCPGGNHWGLLTCSLCPYRPWIQCAFGWLALLLLGAAGTSSDDSAEQAWDRTDPEMGCGWWPGWGERPPPTSIQQASGSFFWKALVF